MYILSEMDNKNFSIATNDLFLNTQFNSEQYPGYLQWYYGKNIPRILSGDGEGLFDLDAYILKGLIFLKYDEKKISTLYVDEEYRRNGLGQKLLEVAFNLLGTDKPLITIPEHKLFMFEKFIRDYNWKESGVINSYHSKEIIFN